MANANISFLSKSKEKNIKEKNNQIVINEPTIKLRLFKSL